MYLLWYWTKYLNAGTGTGGPNVLTDGLVYLFESKHEWNVVVVVVVAVGNTLGICSVG